MGRKSGFPAGRLTAIVMASIVMAGMLAVSGAMAAETKTATGDQWRVEWGGGKAEAIHLQSGKRVVIFESEKSKPGEPAFEGTYKMTSVVGSVLSYTYSWYGEGGAHPSYGKSFSTVDLSRIDDPNKPYPGNPRYRSLPGADLRRMFSEPVLFASLMRDPNIREAVEEGLKKGKPAPTNFSELLRVDGGCRMSMGTALVSNFQFGYLLGGRVAALRIGLTHGCEVMRGTFTDLATLHLPVPETMKKAFHEAVTQGSLEDRPFQKASFNCLKAGAAIEFSICADAGLAELDVALSRRYVGLRKSLKGKARKQIRTSQRAWMKKRDSDCAAGSVKCLTRSYKERLAALEKIGG